MFKVQFVQSGDCVSGHSIEELGLEPRASRPESIKGFSMAPAGNGEPPMAFEQGL